MKAHTEEIFIEILIDGEYKEFKMRVTADVCNDSIGAYEYHGQKCYDHQDDYLGDITEWECMSIATPDEIREINAWMDSHRDEVLEKFEG